jgi:lysophospholipase L1-like esterase
MNTLRFLSYSLAGMVLLWASRAMHAQATASGPATAKEKLPALYVVGDSTAANNNSPTIQGWGTPFLTYFDKTRINVVNAALGGRSSRTYLTEGQLDKLTAKLNPGDIVLLQWGHNDPYPLNDANGRGSLFGIGDETQEIVRSTTSKPETLHTFGWYMRKQIAEIEAKGSKPVILTLTIRDRWINGKIERDPSQTPATATATATSTADNRLKEPTRYSVWSAEIAKAAHLPLLDVHNMIADRYEAEGKSVVDTYFQSASDPTHRNPKGAAVDAEITLACLKTFMGPAFDQVLNDKGKAVPAADAKYIFKNASTDAAPAAVPAARP